MPRPRKCKRICSMPSYLSFKTCNSFDNEIVKILVEEYGVVRLIDYEGLTQEECATVIGIARTSVQKIYDEVRYKISQYLVEGKTLQIEGGNYYLCDKNIGCDRRRFCKNNSINKE